MGNHLDLFSGIGGFALAAHWAGYQTIQFVEIDEWCQKVLAKNFPGVPIHDDIRTYPVESLGRIDLLTGGFPCQPFSVAGKRRGAADDRHLWPEMARVIDAVRPRWVVGENTPGIIGMALDDCLSDLESIGYEAWPVVVPACAVSAPHRRDRVWIVAHDAHGVGEAPISGVREWPDAESPRGGEGNPLADAGCPERRARYSKGRDIQGAEHIHRGRSEGARGIGQRGQAPDEGRTADDANGGRYGAPSKFIRTGRYGAFDPGWWDVEPPMGRVVTGIPGRVDRLRGLGNAIVPQLAYVILSAIVAAEDSTPAAAQLATVL